jgi:hypothetical protein
MGYETRYDYIGDGPVKRAERELVYVAAEGFVDAALKRDDSLFTPGRPIWSAEHAQDLYQRFNLQPDESDRSFEQKLRDQLSGAPPETYQLFGECLYVCYLIPQGIHGSTKQGHIREILSWSPEPVEIPKELAGALDQGLIGAQLAYTVQRPFQLWFIVEFARKWKALSPADREAALGDPWKFKDLLHETPIDKGYVQREALKHLVFPDVFEHIVSREHKKKISRTFADRVTVPSDDVDRQLLQVREALTKERGEPVNFYSQEIKDQWDPPRKPARIPRGKAGATKSATFELADSLDDLANQLYLPEEFLTDTVSLLRQRGQIIFYGPPGTGKTFIARRLIEHLASEPERREIVQFHPSYSYEDFVHGYRPLDKNGTLVYELRPGPLSRLAERAGASQREYFLLIDEINRGNLPKIFGELLYLLEYRSDEVILMYEDEGGFTLPENLLIVGTMNTADRSIGLVDAALRRRFHFIALFPDEPPLAGMLAHWLEDHVPKMAHVAQLLDRLNAKIRPRLGRHLQIGPSHFMREDLTEEVLSQIWEYDVMPFLEDQFYGHEKDLEGFTLPRLRLADDADYPSEGTSTEPPATN